MELHNYRVRRGMRNNSPSVIKLDDGQLIFFKDTKDLYIGCDDEMVKINTDDEMILVNKVESESELPSDAKDRDCYIVKDTLYIKFNGVWYNPGSIRIGESIESSVSSRIFFKTTSESATEFNIEILDPDGNTYYPKSLAKNIWFSKTLNLVGKLSELSTSITTSITELETKHNTEIGTLTQTVNTLSAKHDTEINTVNETISALQTKHDTEVATLTESVSDLTVKHDSELTVINQAIANLETKHNTDLVTINGTIASMETKHNTEVAAINTTLQTIQTDHNEDVDTILGTVSDLETKHNTEVAAINTSLQTVQTSLGTLDGTTNGLKLGVGKENGIKFPADPFGGGGDQGWIYVEKSAYPPAGHENCTSTDGLNYTRPGETTTHLHEFYEVVLEVTNDMSDTNRDAFRVKVPATGTDTKFYVNEHTVIHSGNLATYINSLQTTVNTLSTNLTNLTNQFNAFKNSKSQANGLAPLDASGKVPAANMRSSTAVASMLSAGSRVSINTGNTFTVTMPAYGGICISYSADHSCQHNMYINDVLVFSIGSTAVQTIMINDTQAIRYEAGVLQQTVNVNSIVNGQNNIKFAFGSGCGSPVFNNFTMTGCTTKTI